MKPPSGDCRGSLAKVGGGGCEKRKFRRVEGRGSNGGTIEIFGGGGCEKRKFRRVEGGGSNGGTIEVVGGGGCEKRKCRRVGRGGGVDDSKCCVVLNEDLYLKINGDAGDRERGYGFNREVRGQVVEVVICLLRSIVVLLIDGMMLGERGLCLGEDIEEVY